MDHAAVCGLFDISSLDIFQMMPLLEKNTY